jgi:hypothetical protein
MSAWVGRLHHLLPIGVASLAVLLTVLGVHLLTLSQQAAAASGADVIGASSRYYTGQPAIGGQSSNRDSDLQQGLLASGVLCPIHSFGLFGVESN